MAFLFRFFFHFIFSTTALLSETRFNAPLQPPGLWCIHLFKGRPSGRRENIVTGNNQRNIKRSEVTFDFVLLG